MKRYTWTATAFAVALGCVVATAQTPSTQSTKSDAITVVGCLQDNTSAPSATGTSGSTTPSTTSGKFVLNNATMGSASTSGTAGTSGTAPSTPSASSSMGKSYILEGTESDLKTHVGHKVEITGTTTDSSSSPSAAPSAPAGSGSMASAAHLRVTSVKMIAASCDAK